MSTSLQHRHRGSTRSNGSSRASPSSRSNGVSIARPNSSKQTSSPISKPVMPNRNPSDGQRPQTTSSPRYSASASEPSSSKIDVDRNFGFGTLGDSNPCYRRERAGGENHTSKPLKIRNSQK